MPPTTTTMAPTTTTMAATTTMAPTTTIPTTTTTALANGAVLAITFQTGSCIGCPSGTAEGGLKVRLVSETGWECQTDGLDHPQRKDYEAGAYARFEEGGVDGLLGCYHEAVPGSLAGGSVTWTGSGMFAASKRDICVELSDASWCCKMKGGYSTNNEAVELENCAVQP